MIANPNMLNQVITISNSIDCQMMVQIILLLDMDRAAIVFVEEGNCFYSLSCSTQNIDGMLSVAIDNLVAAGDLPEFVKDFRSRYVSIFDQLISQAREINEQKQRQERIAKWKAEAWRIFEMSLLALAAGLIARALWF